MKKIGILFFLAALGWPNHANAQEAEVLSLGDYLKRVASYSRFEELLIDRLTAAFQWEADLPANELVLSVRAGYAVSIESLDRNAPGGSITLESLFPYSGTAVTGSYETGIDFEAARTSGFAIGLEQDVLRNAFGRTAWIRKELADLNKDIALYGVAEAYEEFLASLINVYMDWLSAYEEMLVSKKSYDASVTLLSLIRSKLRFNIALPVDVHLTELVVMTREERYKNATSAFSLRSIDLGLYAGLERVAEKYIPESVRLYESAPVPGGDLEKIFMDNSRTMRLLGFIERTEERNLEIALDNLLPELKLYANYDFSGDGFFPAANAANNAEIGVTLGIPLLGSNAETLADIRKANAQKIKLVVTGRKKAAIAQLDSIVESVANARSNIVLLERKKTAAEAIVKEEQDRYNQGRSSTNDLIDAYDTLDSVLQDSLEYSIRLNKLTLDSLRLTDTLVDENMKLTGNVGE